jgi:hypothetical protein
MKTSSTLTVLSLVLLATSAFTLPTSAAEALGKIKVLLVTGDDVQPAHNWREVSQAIRETLVSSGKFDVRVCEDAGVLDSAATLSRYDLVFLHMYNAKTPTLSAGAKENLATFVKDGKGQALRPLLGDGQIGPRAPRGFQGTDREQGPSDHSGPGRL